MTTTADPLGHPRHRQDRPRLRHRTSHATPGAVIAAVGSRSRESAEAFARDARRRAHPRPRVVRRRWCADPDVDVVYVASPHSLHLEHARLAFAAGKPVLCEKPLTLDPRRRRGAVRLRGRPVLMEAMWMACHPLVRDLRARLAAGEFGTPRQVHADLGFVVPADASDRMLDPALGAGALLDMGIYPLTFARLMLGPYAAAVAAGDLGEQRHRPRRGDRRPARGRRRLGPDHVDDLREPAGGHRRHRRGPARGARRLPPPDVRRLDAGRAGEPQRIEPPSPVSAPGSATRRPTCRTACATG